MNIGGFLRRNALAIGLLTSFSGCSALIGTPIVQGEVHYLRWSNCQSNLAQIALACAQYKADNNWHYPPLSGGNSRGWALLIQESKKPLNLSCPEGYKSSYSPTSDYFFNARLATRSEETITNPELALAFGDGPDNGPTNSHYLELPSDKDNPNSPMNRHHEGANYAFIDGHVKFMTSRMIRAQSVTIDPQIFAFPTPTARKNSLSPHHVPKGNSSG